MELIRSLWRGDVPLVKTYWLYNVVANIIFRLAFVYCQAYDNVFMYGPGALVVLGLTLFWFVYTIFICVAIWRSANKYRGLTVYAVLAKGTVILNAVALIGQVAGYVGRYL